MSTIPHYPVRKRGGRVGPRFTRDNDEACGFTYDEDDPNRHELTFRRLIEVLRAVRTPSVRLIVCGELSVPYHFGNTDFAAGCLLCAPSAVRTAQALGVLTSALITGGRQQADRPGPRTDPTPELSEITEYEWRDVLTVYVEEI